MLFIILNNGEHLDIQNLILEGLAYDKIINFEETNGYSISHLLNKTKSHATRRNRWSFYDPILDELMGIILSLLKNGRKSYNNKKIVSLTNKEIFNLLIYKGYPISITKTNELARDCRQMLKDSYLHINHLPGDKVEFDWGSINLHIADKKKITKVYLAVFSFPYSNYKKIYALKKSDGKSFVSALNRFIKDMGGVPPLFILDNMKIARQFSSDIDSNVKLTSLFDELCEHYDFNVRFCSPYSPHEKGNVENNVGVIKKQFENSYINSFNNMGQVQEFINKKVDMLNKRKHPFKNDLCKNLINHERTTFRKPPKTPYVFYYSRYSKVSNNGLFKLNNNYYSVPETFKGQEVFVKYNKKKIIVYTLDKNDTIATYIPSKGKENRNLRVWYMLHKLKRKSNAFKNSLEYRSMPKHLKLVLDKIFNNDCSDFIKFLYNIKNKSKRKLRKFVYKNQYNLNDFLEEDIIKLLC